MKQRYQLQKFSRLHRFARRLQLQLEALKKDILTIEDKIAKHRQTLHALDEVLGLHEIKVEPDHIVPVRPHYNAPLLRHGQLTRSVLTHLRRESPRPCSTVELANVVASKLPLGTADVVKVRRIVRRRLRHLFTRGIVDRHWDSSQRDSLGRSSLAYWRLSGMNGDDAQNLES